MGDRGGSEKTREGRVTERSMTLLGIGRQGRKVRGSVRFTGFRDGERVVGVMDSSRPATTIAAVPASSSPRMCCACVSVPETGS